MNREDWRFYAIDMVASILSLLAATSRTFMALAFPVYMICINGVIAALALRKVDALAVVADD